MRTDEKEELMKEVKKSNEEWALINVNSGNLKIEKEDNRVNRK
jgi:hypothetical protein